MMSRPQTPLIRMRGQGYKLLVEQLEQRLAMDGALPQFCLSDETELPAAQLPTSLPASELRLDHFLAAKGLLHHSEILESSLSRNDPQDKDTIEAEGEGEGPGPMDFVAGRPTLNRPIATVFDPNFAIDRLPLLGPVQMNQPSNVGDTITSHSGSLGVRPTDAIPSRVSSIEPTAMTEGTNRKPNDVFARSEVSNVLASDRLLAAYSDLGTIADREDTFALSVALGQSTSFYDHSWMESLNPVVFAALDGERQDGSVQQAAALDGFSNPVGAAVGWRLVIEPFKDSESARADIDRREAFSHSFERAALQQANGERSHRTRRDRHRPIAIHPGKTNGHSSSDIHRGQDSLVNHDLAGVGMHRSTGQPVGRWQSLHPAATRSVWENAPMEMIAADVTAQKDENTHSSEFELGTVVSEDGTGVAYAFAPGFFVMFCGVAWLATSRKRMGAHENVEGSAFSQSENDSTSHRTW